MNYSIILSGGIGSRMRTDGFPKQYIDVNGKPILVYTLEQFHSSESVDKIVIVADPAWQASITEWITAYNLASKFLGFASPGSSRQGSILNGLHVCMKEVNDSQKDCVIIHDAVRPLVSQKLINDCFDALEDADGCMPVLPVTDTTYYSEDGVNISDLLNRDKLFAGQAPEAFDLKKYYDVNCSVSEDEIEQTRGTTEIAYKHGLKVKMILGDYGNFKITTPTDLDRFKTVLEGKE